VESLRRLSCSEVPEDVKRRENFSIMKQQFA
jgi:hypothetical protein